MLTTFRDRPRLSLPSHLLAFLRSLILLTLGVLSAVAPAACSDTPEEPEDLPDEIHYEFFSSTHQLSAESLAAICSLVDDGTSCSSSAETCRSQAACRSLSTR